MSMNHVDASATADRFGPELRQLRGRRVLRGFRETGRHLGVLKPLELPGSSLPAGRRQSEGSQHRAETGPGQVQLTCAGRELRT